MAIELIRRVLGIFRRPVVLTSVDSMLLLLVINLSSTVDVFFDRFCQQTNGLSICAVLHQVSLKFLIFSE